MPRPGAELREILTPWTAGLDPVWSLDKAKRALNEHEWGSFTSSSMMVEAMLRDDRIAAVLETLINGFLSLPFAVEAAVVPEDEPNAAARTELAEDIRAQLADQWDESFPRDELAQLIFWYVTLGVAVARIEWQREADVWRPRLKVWHPQFLRWQHSDRTWRINTQEEPDREIVPGDGEWVLLSRGDRGWMQGAIRQLVIPWLIRQFAWRDWARYSERHGLPILKGKVPAQASAPDKKQFRKGMQALVSATSVTLPQGVGGSDQDFDLELLEAKDRSWEGFQKLLDQCNTAIAVRLLGQNLTTEVKGGSLAAAQIHDRVRLDRIEFISNDVSENLGDQVINHWLVFNRGADAAGLEPFPSWDTEPPKDLKDRGAAIGALADGLVALHKAGVQPTEASFNELQNEFGIQLEEREQPEPAAPAPPDGGGDPDPDDDEDSEPNDGDGSLGRRAGSATIRLQSGEDPTTAPGFIDGQLYADALADSGIEESAKLIRKDVERLAGVIRSADGYADLREKLRAEYGEMNAEEFTNLMASALTLAELGGRHAVNVDV